jgi:hypothetical protein
VEHGCASGRDIMGLAAHFSSSRQVVGWQWDIRAAVATGATGATGATLSVARTDAARIKARRLTMTDFIW